MPEITLGLVVGIFFLVMLVGSFAYILMHKPGAARRRARNLDTE